VSIQPSGTISAATPSAAPFRNKVRKAPQIKRAHSRPTFHLSTVSMARTTGRSCSGSDSTSDLVTGWRNRRPNGIGELVMRTIFSSSDGNRAGSIASFCRRTMRSPFRPRRISTCGAPNVSTAMTSTIGYSSDDASGRCCTCARAIAIAASTNVRCQSLRTCRCFNSIKELSCCETRCKRLAPGVRTDFAYVSLAMTSLVGVRLHPTAGLSVELTSDKPPCASQRTCNGAQVAGGERKRTAQCVGKGV
jgi:hypothetical protein